MKSECGSPEETMISRTILIKHYQTSSFFSDCLPIRGGGHRTLGIGRKIKAKIGMPT